MRLFLNSVPLSDKMYLGHMCTGRCLLMKVETIVSSDLSGIGNASGHPVKLSMMASISNINLISLRAIYKQENIEHQAGLEPAPLAVQVSALPLDHLHSMISPCLNSHPRALLCPIHDLDTVCTCALLCNFKFWRQMHMCIIKMLMCMHLDGLPSSKYTCYQIAYMNQI